MKSTIPIDRAGRLVLPKAFRTRLHLEEGDLLEVELDAYGVRLRPLVASQSRMIRQNGRSVWDAPGASASIEEIEKTMNRGRNERDARASGLSQ